MFTNRTAAGTLTGTYTRFCDALIAAKRVAFWAGQCTIYNDGGKLITIYGKV